MAYTFSDTCREVHVKQTKLPQQWEKNGGPGFISPKDKVAKEGKPLRLLISKLELPWACCSFSWVEQIQQYCMYLGGFIIIVF